MTHWRRAPLPTICGCCGHIVPIGDPLFVIRIDGVKRATYRCAQWKCCESAVPTDLPALEAPSADLRVKGTQSRLPLDDGLRERLHALMVRK